MKYIVGNWKMNMTASEIVEFSKKLKKYKFPKNSDVMFGLAVAFVYILGMDKMQSNMMMIGAQNVSNHERGAYTGEISAEMLADCGLDFCIVGHSERRAYFNETDEIINEKMKRLQENGVLPILCIGETATQFEQGKTKEVLRAQLERDLAGLNKKEQIIIAYEPVWAIGTGKSASGELVQDTIKFIKQTLDEIWGKQEHIVLYGGSVNPANSGELLANDIVDGALIGGASLDCDRFMEIASSVFRG